MSPRRSSSRGAGLTGAQVRALFKRAGLEPPKLPSKYGNVWTYYNGTYLHSTGRDCGPLPVERCPVCGDATIKADRGHWYPSRSEASFAAKLDERVKTGLVIRWSRSKNLTLSEAPDRSDRVVYKPDFDVWLKSSNASPVPDVRYEVKGARRMISQQGWLRIKLYRAAVARGEQPPLHLVDGNGNDLTP